MKRLAIIAILAAAFAGCRRTDVASMSPLRFVDPYIGSGGHGHVFVGADVPFGAVKLGPHEPYRGWDWCSGYHYSDSVLLGFSHTRLNGTGIGELGDILMIPVTEQTRRDSTGRYWTRLDHDRETVRAGYYALKLDEGIDVELTAASRTGLHRYRFPSSEVSIVLDLEAGIGWDSMTDCSVCTVDDRRIEGYRRSTGWAKDQICYFAAEFSQPMTKAEPDGYNRMKYTFSTDGGQLEIKVGISAVNCANARANIAADVAGRSFDAMVVAAADEWNKSLSVIEIEPLDESQARVFYTALYHTMTAPSLFCDSNGEYRGADGEVHTCDGGNYTIFSLWDTYRAASPLMTIIDPQRAHDFGASMMRIYDEQGKLPVWHLAGNETDCMVGNPGVIVMGDLLLKGLVDDPQAVLEAMKRSSMIDERGMELLKRYGYIPFDKSAELETVAKGLEFAIADDAVARVARRLGDAEAERYFSERSKSYRYYFDPETRFMRGRASDGSFRTPFDPFKALHMRSDFTEGNAWQYTWLVPHDIDGLIELLGGREAFVQKLEEFFVAEGDLGPDANDVTGLVGQYAHGNEPSHHITYMFDYVGRNYRCAQLVRHILSELYADDPDGVCGNEDVGQMSAWYVLSSLGLYQVEPAGGEFMIGSPAVRRAVINLGGGRTFTISAPDNSESNIYVAAVRLNGQPLDKPRITYEQIMAGGVLEFDMTDRIPVRPPLEFDDQVYDFGKIDEAAGRVSHTFTFVNTTDHPAVVVRVLTPCSCITADPSGEVVMPDARGRLTVNYDPAYRDGFFSEGLDVIFVQGERERHTRIWVNGTVIPCKHPIEEDHPYNLGEGLHTNLNVLLAGGLRAGESKSILFNYANAQQKRVEVRFDVEGPTASSLEMPRRLKLEPDERGQMSIEYTMPAGRLGMQQLTVRPYVDGKPVQPVEFMAVGQPAVQASAESRPELTYSPFRISMPASDQPLSSQLTLGNEGSAPLNILWVDMPDGIVSDLTSGIAIAAGEQRSFTLTAAPSTNGYDGRLCVVTDDPRIPYIIIGINSSAE